VLESNPQKIAELHLQNDFLFLEGDATHDQILLEAGIKAAKSLIVSLGDDADNVFVTLSARQLNPKLNIVSRASNLMTERKLMRVGANHVVLPERLGGFYMATLVRKPEVVEFFTLISNMGSAQIQFEEIETDALGQLFIGKSLIDLNIRTQTGVNIIGLRDTNGLYTVNPSPNTLLVSGMKIIVLGDLEQMNRFRAMMR
jgi:voltage-gated potassium channel